MDSNTTLNLERDLDVVEAAAADLKDYLLSSTLYWTLSAKPRPASPLPKSTLGAILFRLHRLDALVDRLDSGQRQRFRAVRRQVADELEHWHVQAEAKALLDLKSRIRAWAAFLEELADNPRRYVPEYPTQAEGRTVMAVLLGYAGSAADRSGHTARVRSLDVTLRDITSQGDFVWAAAMQPAFPRDDFWWLYVTPRLRPES
jgi:hypothetical protein